MLGKQDFEKIADILHKHNAKPAIIEDFREWLETTNPNFKQGLFLDRATMGWKGGE